jgi:hypothetical protein
MDANNTLPKLPEPAFTVQVPTAAAAGAVIAPPYQPVTFVASSVALSHYTADQMLAWGQEVRRMALAEAAAVAEDMPITYERDGHYFETQPEDYATAIRALIEKQRTE